MRRYQQVVTNEVRTVPLAAPRGLILDRGDNVLVGDGVSEDITLSRVDRRASIPRS